MSFSIIFLLPPLLHRISKSPTYLTRTSLSSGYFLRRSLFPVYIFPANLTPTLITSSIHTRSQRRKIEGRMDELDTIKIIAFYICRFTLLYRLKHKGDNGNSVLPFCLNICCGIKVVYMCVIWKIIIISLVNYRCLIKTSH